MKLFRIHILFLSLACSMQTLAGFDVRIENNNSMTISVMPHLVDKSTYVRSDALTTSVNLQYRGGCNDGYALKKFDVMLGNTTHNIPVSGDNTHITGNKGNAWSTHPFPGFTIPANHSGLIAACNTHVSQKQAQGYDLESLLNSDFVLDGVDISVEAKQRSTCKKRGSLFDAPPGSWVVEDTMRVKVRCKATGYKEPVNVSNVQLAIDKNITLGGACKVGLKGALTTNKGNQLVRFRYEHIDENFAKKLSPIHQVTTDQQGYANFSHQYDVANGPGKEKGKIRVLGVSHEFQSQQKNYSMDCNSPGSNTLQQATPSTINLTVTPVENSKQAFGAQLCPTQVKIEGSITAGSDISGQAVFVGQSLGDVQTQPFSINQGQTKKVTHLRTLNWTVPAAATLSIGGGGSSTQLMTQQFMQGLNITGQNNQLALSYPRQPYTVSCSAGAVAPGMQVPGAGFSALPDHTGGGGAPTDLQSTGNTQDTPYTQGPKKTLPSKKSLPTSK